MFHGPGKSKRKVIKDCKTWTHYQSYALLIGPSAFVASAMGFLSFKLKSSKFVFWKLHFVYATILTTLFVIGMLCSVYSLNVSYKFRDTANMVHNNIMLFSGVAIAVTTYVNNLSMNKAIQSVSDVSRVIPPKLFGRMTKIVFLKDLMLTSPLLSFIPMLFKYYKEVPFLLIFFMFVGVFTLINLYTSNVYVLGACFQQINESLEKVKEMLINDKPHLLRRVFHAQNNPVLLAMLRTQKQQHLEMSKTVYKLNSAFSMQIEGSLLLLIVDLTFNVYSYAVVCSNDDEIKKSGYDITFAIVNSIIIFLTILIVDFTRSEMEKIGFNVHRILIHTMDEKMTMELEMFSLQVLQRGNTFALKAIILHFSYLTQIVCGVSTLLLILIQFLVSEPC